MAICAFEEVSPGAFSVCQQKQPLPIRVFPMIYANRI